MTVDDDFSALLRRAKSGDKEATEAVLVRHLPAIRAFVRLRADPTLRAKESCSDLVQSVCRDVLEGLPRFRGEDEQVFKQWLYVEALHKVIDRHRRYHAQRRDAARDALPETDDGSEVLDCYRSFCTPSRDAVAREEVARVEAAFEQLPEEYREVITLARVAGLSHREIADLQGRTEEAVRKLLSRARARLMILLG